MPKTKARRGSRPARFRAAISQVRALKDESNGVVWRRLHRVESELVTAAGQKRPMPSHARVVQRAARQAKKKPKAKA